jgi:hypothetical protein
MEKGLATGREGTVNWEGGDCQQGRMKLSTGKEGTVN